MPRITPDPSFYPTAGQAATAPAEQLAYVATIGVGENGDTPPDAIGVIDLNRESESYWSRRRFSAPERGRPTPTPGLCTTCQFWAAAFVLAGLVTFLT